MDVTALSIAEAQALAARRARNSRAGRPLDAVEPDEAPVSTPGVVSVEAETEGAREKETQAKVMARFRNFGFHVYNLSQPRRTKQTPGLPDLWVVHGARGLAFWWETKRPTGGRFSSAQVEFADECRAAGVGYGAGSLADAEAYLIALGVCVRTGDDLHPCPIEESWPPA